MSEVIGRPARRINLKGRRFGRLVVVGFSHSIKWGTCWKCRCDCGNECTVSSKNLRKLRQRSCGCLRVDMGKAKLGTRHPVKLTPDQIAERRRAATRRHNQNYRNIARQRRRILRKQVRSKPLCCEACDADASLTLDHCHVSGLFRGWLCGPCNRALGHAKDDIGRLRKLIAYLER